MKSRKLWKVGDLVYFGYEERPSKIIAISGDLVMLKPPYKGIAGSVVFKGDLRQRRFRLKRKS